MNYNQFFPLPKHTTIDPLCLCLLEVSPPTMAPPWGPGLDFHPNVSDSPKITAKIPGITDATLYCDGQHVVKCLF